MRIPFFTKKKPNIITYTDTSNDVSNMRFSFTKKEANAFLEKEKNILTMLVDNENAYRNKIKSIANSNDEKYVCNSLSIDEVIKQIKEDLIVSSSFNPLNFNGDWKSHYGNMSYGYKIMLLYRLGYKCGFFQCLTYQQTLLRNLYDSNNVMKEVLQSVVYLSFNNLTITSKIINIDDTKKQLFLSQLFYIIEMCELTGGVVVEIENNQLVINDTDRGSIKEEDFIYNENSTKFPIASINKPTGTNYKGVAPFGLSWFEDKVEALEMEKEAKRTMHETMVRQSFLLLKIAETEWRTPTKEQIDLLNERLQAMSNRDAMSTLSVPYGADAEFKTASVNFLDHLEVCNYAKQELSSGVPVALWKGEKGGSINIGNNDDSYKMLDKIVSRMRNNYNYFISFIAKKYFNTNDIQINYSDLLDRDSAREVESYEKIANIISSLSNDIDMQEDLQEIKSTLLEKIRQKLN